MRGVGATIVLATALMLAYRFLVRRLNALMLFLQQEGGASPKDPSPGYVGAARILRAALLLVFLGGGGLLLLAAWGVAPGEFVAALARPLFGSGGLTGTTLLGAVGSVLAIVLAGALVREVLVFFVFPRSELDQGARYAVISVVRYLVWAWAVLAGMDALGVDASALAVFAGAAGVGLAFGLQDIFANFFSGLIMLLERPVRVGDLVEVGGVSGSVEAIRLRGTTIRTFDRTIVVIPNRQMIGERLTNLSHRVAASRVLVAVGVGYDSDIRRVRDALLAAAATQPPVLRDPPPDVRLEGFGESSLDFVLVCFTDRAGDRLQVASGLRTAILERFRKDGIEIPFPQRDLRILREDGADA
jgi:potassium efflux system protein